MSAPKNNHRRCRVLLFLVVGAVLVSGGWTTITLYRMAHRDGGVAPFTAEAEPDVPALQAMSRAVLDEVLGKL